MSTPAELSLKTRLWRLAFGPPEIQPLAVAQGIASIGDAFVGLSLAGSLFFNLSPNASRQQVLLYLLVAVAPLAVLAPLIGPTVDRFRHHRRILAASAYVLRAGFCLALAATLFRLSFFGFALGLLIAGKASGIVKQALIPMLVTDPEQLVATNARLSRTGSIIGAIGGAAAFGLEKLVEETGLLRLAAAVYLCSALVISRALPAHPPAEQEIPPSELEYAETHSPQVVVGAIGFMAIRAAVGFYVFTLAFTLRRENESIPVYAAAVVIYGAGAVGGNLLAPILRKRFSDQQLIAIAIAAPTVPTLFGILGVSRPLLFAIAATIGMSTTLGRHGFDSLLQHRAPAGLRGRAAARYETQFQLVWALGAVIAIPISLPVEASMAVLATLYVPALLTFVRGFRNARDFEEKAVFDVLGRAGTRLAAAEEAFASESWTVAIVEAAAASDLARVESPEIASRAEYGELRQLRLAALDGDVETTPEQAQGALNLAETLLSSARALSPP